ncbi:MAG: two-component system OmpR family response regulator [Saprospiraceae bacterium]|jgi:two-component system OmpR family response regulator
MIDQSIIEKRTLTIPKQADTNQYLKKRKTAIKQYTIFCVDDSKIILHMLKYNLKSNPNFDLYFFENREDAIKNLDLQPDIVILDFHLTTDPSGKFKLNGLGVLEKIKEISPESKVLMLSSQESISVAVSCLKKGAIDYIIKDKVIKINVTKSVEGTIKSIELKQEIQNIFQKIKRDKLLIKGYFTIVMSLSMVVLYQIFL